MSFDQFAESAWKGSMVRLYRMDGKATTDYGVVIRQERTILPGILVTRKLDTFYPCTELEITSTKEGIRVEDQRGDCRAFPDDVRDYRLKRFLFF